MLKRSLIIASLLSFSLAADAGCKKKETKPPVEDDESLGGDKDETPAGVSEDNEDDLVSYASADDTEGEGELGEEDSGEPAKKVERPEVKEVCKGRGKKRKCKMVDSNPKLSASLGVKALIKGYEWGMGPEAVLAQLSKKIERQYAKKQKKTSDPMMQDRNRKWKQEQLNELKKGHVKFTSASRHKWGVSLIQYDFEDDNGEEMVWIRDGTLRKFYFFKDGGLWKIVYAFNTEKWPGKTYEEVTEKTFKEWFGINPEEKVKQDPKTARPLLRYNEWTSEKDEKIRTFNQSAVHGVYVISVVDGNIETSIGERLPNIKEDEKFSDDVGDVLGGSDVVYDENGNIVEGTPDPVEE